MMSEHQFLQIKQMEESLSIGQKQRLAKRVEPFTMKNDVLYRMGKDNKLKRCLSSTKV